MELEMVQGQLEQLKTKPDTTIDQYSLKDKYQSSM